MLEIKPEILASIPEKNCCGLIFVRTMFYMYGQAPEMCIDKLIKVLNNFYPSMELNFWKENLLISGNLFNLLQDLDLDNLFKTENFDECCKLTLLKSLFVTCGNLYYNTDTKINSKGYNLEFVCKPNFYVNVLNLLENFEFCLKTTTRQNCKIIYTKNSTIICDLLVKLGAVYSSFEVQNSLAIRELRNLTNRQNNCFENNINKTISASNIQLEAINFIVDNYTIDYFDDSLKEVALARLANPEVSLNELKVLLQNKISRAGIKYRLDKIIAIYQNLKGENL